MSPTHWPLPTTHRIDALHNTRLFLFWHSSVVFCFAFYMVSHTYLLSLYNTSFNKTSSCQRLCKIWLNLKFWWVFETREYTSIWRFMQCHVYNNTDVLKCKRPPHMFSRLLNLLLEPVKLVHPLSISSNLAIRAVVATDTCLSTVEPLRSTSRQSRLSRQGGQYQSLEPWKPVDTAK